MKDHKCTAPSSRHIYPDAGGKQGRSEDYLSHFRGEGVQKLEGFLSVGWSRQYFGEQTGIRNRSQS